MSDFPQIQVRVFKCFAPDRTESYEVRTQGGSVDNATSAFFKSLGKAAEFTSQIIEDNIREYEGYEGSGWRKPETIVFAPEWDIICSERNKKIIPRYCTALSEIERYTFWRYFIETF